MSTKIHLTAQVSSTAQLDEGVIIGPYSIIHDNVCIGKNTIIDSHVCVGSPSTEVSIGKNNHIFSSSMIGLPPQDLSYKQEKTKLSIGDNNTIRSFVTMDAGTAKDQGLTSVGNHNLIMAYVHIAHDCHIKDKVVLANLVQLAGHVKVDSQVVIGGGVLVAQKVRLGNLAYVAGDSSVNKDIAPFSIAAGRWASLRAVNKIGLERANFKQKDILELRSAFRSLLSGKQTQEEWLCQLEEKKDLSDSAKTLIQFVKSSALGLAR
ncbi:MAG: acyl-ACP--UDP-N-acetylglucosamine O-acyltransferase [Bdellovibrionaceae bacterium]|nr:acyl-ACP--UDP-N-acetylglucosamine O-acyltransferase [Pseudobdellovibrionaceae bacterium]